MTNGLGDAAVGVELAAGLVDDAAGNLAAASTVDGKPSVAAVD